MQNIHLQFNMDLIEQVKNFLESKNDVLLFCAPSGTGKSAVLNIALNEYKDDFLQFYYYCNSLTAIEDFLLGFYDTLRDYTIHKKIILKKDLSDNFTQKVSNYMKAISQDTLIIIDNYDKIKTNEGINNFLSDISKQEKTKLILLSRDDILPDKFIANNLRVAKVEKQKEDKDSIIQKISKACPAEDLGSIIELYKISNANTILLQTTFSYINITNTRLYKLVDEFYKKQQSYENFITSLALSLIPQNYMDSIRTLGLANFITPINYLEHYKLFNTSYIPYLQQRLIVNQINRNVYEFENVKNFLLQSLSVADKIQYGDIIINSLKSELAKGPKDRLLRLSREGLRRQIENLENIIPHINSKMPTNAQVSYYSHIQNFTVPWLSQNSAFDILKKEEAPKTQAQEDLEMLKQFRQNTYENKVQKQEKTNAELKKELQTKLKKCEEEFDFQNAILLLNELVKIDSENENEILEKIAENYIKLDKKDEAISYYIKVSDNYKNENDKDRYYKTLLKIGDAKSGKYELKEAESIYKKIAEEAENEENVIKALCSLGKTEEKKNDEEDALNYYNKALEISVKKGQDKDISEINYLIAGIYEKQNKTESAKKYYKNSIEKGADNPNVAESYLGLALLLFDENNIKEAVNNFEIAISKFKEEKTPNPSSLYSANSNLAYIYKAANSDKEHYYLNEALKWAIVMDDKFEIANTHVALGDYCYNKSLNKDALINYLKAKDTLNEDKNSQNQMMIASRIEDMKYKLREDFENIVEEYEQTKH